MIEFSETILEEIKIFRILAVKRRWPPKTVVVKPVIAEDNS